MTGTGTPTEGNGCARFVEIATQTVNLTNILTNLNSSVAICNDTSEPCTDQTMSPTTNTARNDDQRNASNQLHSAKSNNGHCIIDDHSNNDAEDGNTQRLPVQIDKSDADADSIIDSHQTDCAITPKIEDSTTLTQDCQQTDRNADETDVGRKHASTDGINGPANNLRV